MKYENYTKIWKLHYENFNILRNAPKIMVKSVTQFESPNYHHKKLNASALQITKIGSNFFLRWKMYFLNVKKNVKQKKFKMKVTKYKLYFKIWTYHCFWD